MEIFFSNFMLLFIVVDPIGVAAVYSGLVARETVAVQRRIALVGTLVAGGIILLFFFLGDYLLAWLGISIAAFRVAGGVLLFLLAIDMVLARDSGLRTATETERDEAANRQDISVFPLAFPLIAGPGALTTSLLMASHIEVERDYAVMLGIILLVLAITLVALLLAPRIMRVFGATGVNVVNRVLGLLLAALAAQYVLDGVKASLGLS